jgi:hypothetical protein
LALGFLATKERSDVLTLSVPTELAAELADALDHLGESGGLTRELVDRGSLTAPRARLRELVAAAIDESGESLGVECNRLLRGEATAGEVRARVARLSGLLALFERLAEEAEPGRGAAVDVDRLPGDEAGGR